MGEQDLQLLAHHLHSECTLRRQVRAMSAFEVFQQQLCLQDGIAVEHCEYCATAAPWYGKLQCLLAIERERHLSDKLTGMQIAANH